MINHVHSHCPEWKDPGGSSIPIETADILKSLGKTDQEIDWILEEQETFEAEDAAFKALTDV
jgi:hypothetical protein